MNAIEKAMASQRIVELTRETRAKVTAALEAPEDKQLPLVVDALGTAVEAMGAMTDRLVAELLP